MNILISCLSYKEYTGSELYYYELRSALVDKGHNVDIFTPNHGAPLIKHTNSMNIINEKDLNNKEYDLVIFSPSST